MTAADLFPSLPSWQANRLAELVDALGEVEVTAEELNSLTWLAGWEQHTVRAIAAVITRVRESASPSVTAMRSWLTDCTWADVTPDDIARMPDVQILRAVDRHWAGGLAEFLRTFEEDSR